VGSDSAAGAGMGRGGLTRYMTKDLGPVGAGVVHADKILPGTSNFSASDCGVKRRLLERTDWKASDERKGSPMASFTS
jgi:hypothetical protein